MLYRCACLLIFCFACRRSHQSDCHVGAVPGKESVVPSDYLLHGVSVLGCNLWSRSGEGIPAGLLRNCGGGANRVAHGYTLGDGLGAEIVGTFILVYTVLSATDPKRQARDSFVPVCNRNHSEDVHSFTVMIGCQKFSAAL